MGLSSVVSAAPVSVFQHYDDDVPEEQGASLWVLYVASAVLVLLGGAFAGLTIAYVLCHSSLNPSFTWYGSTIIEPRV